MSINKLKIEEDGSLISRLFRNTVMKKINEIIENLNTILNSGYNNVYYGVACSDETTALTVATVLTFRMPHAMTLTEVRGSLTTAQSAGNKLTISITAGGSAIFSTNLTFDNNEETTTTASVPAVISNSSLTDDEEIVVSITQVGVAADAAGLKLWFIGEKVV